MEVNGVNKIWNPQNVNTQQTGSSGQLNEYFVVPAPRHNVIVDIITTLLDRQGLTFTSLNKLLVYQIGVGLQTIKNETGSFEVINKDSEIITINFNNSSISLSYNDSTFTIAEKNLPNNYIEIMKDNISTDTLIMYKSSLKMNQSSFFRLVDQYDLDGKCYPIAIALLEIAIDISPSPRYKILLRRKYFEFGLEILENTLHVEKQDDYEEVIKYFKNDIGYEYNKQIKEKLYKGCIMPYLCKTLQYTEAVKCFQQAMDLSYDENSCQYRMFKAFYAICRSDKLENVVVQKWIEEQGELDGLVQMFKNYNLEFDAEEYEEQIKSTEVNNKIGVKSLVAIYLEQGSILYARENYKKALDYLSIGIKNTDNQNYIFIYKQLIELSICYLFSEQYDDAKKYAETAIDIMFKEQLNEENYIYIIYAKLEQYYQYANNNQHNMNNVREYLGVLYCLYSKFLYNANGYSEKIKNILQSKVINKHFVSNHEPEIGMLEKYLTTAIQFGNEEAKQLLSRIFVILGSHYYKRLEHESAIKSFRQAIEFGCKEVIKVCEDYGMKLYDKKEYKPSIPYFTIAIEFDSLESMYNLVMLWCEEGIVIDSATWQNLKTKVHEIDISKLMELELEYYKEIRYFISCELTEDRIVQIKKDFLLQICPLTHFEIVDLHFVQVECRRTGKDTYCYEFYDAKSLDDVLRKYENKSPVSKQVLTLYEGTVEIPEHCHMSLETFLEVIKNK